MASWEVNNSNQSAKSTVTFISTEKDVIKTLQGLSKTALRASGKVVRKLLRNSIPKRSGNFKNHIATWAFVDKTSGQPQLQVGFYSWQRLKKRGKKPSRASPWWVEYGTKPHTIKVNNAKILGNNGYFYAPTVQHTGQKEQHTLRNTVYDNISEIQKAQEQYLAELNNELEAAANKIVESEDVEDD